jgi:hypothetical protein
MTAPEAKTHAADIAGIWTHWPLINTRSQWEPVKLYMTSSIRAHVAVKVFKPGHEARRENIRRDL